MVFCTFSICRDHDISRKIIREITLNNIMNRVLTEFAEWLNRMVNMYINVY